MGLSRAALRKAAAQAAAFADSTISAAICADHFSNAAFTSAACLSRWYTLTMPPSAPERWFDRQLDDVRQHAKPLLSGPAALRITDVADSFFADLRFGANVRDYVAPTPGQEQQLDQGTELRPPELHRSPQNRKSLRRNILARTVPQTPLAGGATDTAQAASGLISTA